MLKNIPGQFSAPLGVVIIFLLAVILSSCASMRQFNAMSKEERAEYIAIAPKMSIDQRKTYLSKGDMEARAVYLKELGLYTEYVENAAFTRLEEERKSDFLKAYLMASSAERSHFMASFDDDTQDRIKEKDLQHGWSNREVILSLGKPSDILENTVKDKSKQLWIYENPTVATFLYFEDGRLTNWAN